MDAKPGGVLYLQPFLRGKITKRPDSEFSNRIGAFDIDKKTKLCYNTVELCKSYFLMRYAKAVVRARYGTGDFLKLNKRNCDLQIKLTPIGADLLKVQMRIDGTRREFLLSGVLGSQFSSFLTALYCLYEEEDLEHWHYRRRNRNLKRERDTRTIDGNYTASAELHWDSEGYGHASITLVRESPTLLPTPSEAPDPVTVIIRQRKSKRYTVDGRDLCYAVAKAYTDAMKKYGFKGFYKSCAGYDPGDSIDVRELLFVKAYALDALDAIKTEKAWESPGGWAKADRSVIEKELQLLAFDM